MIKDSNDHEQGSKTPVDESRRDFVRTAAYVAPAVLTLSAVPSIAQAGSVEPQAA